GRLTMADLASYRAVWRRPLRIAYHGRREIYTNPPPSSGGVLIGHMLAVLRGVTEPLSPGRARTLRAYAEAMRSAARMRDRRFERLQPAALGAHAGRNQRDRPRDGRTRGDRPPARARRGRPARLRGRLRSGRDREARALGRAGEPVRRPQPVFRRRQCGGGPG